MITYARGFTPPAHGQAYLRVTAPEGLAFALPIDTACDTSDGDSTLEDFCEFELPDALGHLPRQWWDIDPDSDANCGFVEYCQANPPDGWTFDWIENGWER